MPCTTVERGLKTSWENSWKSARSLLYFLKGEKRSHKTVTVNPSAFKLPDRPLNENLILDLTEWVIDLTERIIPNSKNKKSEILKRLCEQFYFDDGRLQQCDVAGTA